MDFIRFETQKTPYLKYDAKTCLLFIPCRSGEWDECECMDWVDDWDCVSLTVDPRVVNETTHLEEGQSTISIEYNHILDLVEPRHIYAVVSLKDNEWGIDYWLA